MRAGGTLTVLALAACLGAPAAAEETATEETAEQVTTDEATTQVTTVDETGLLAGWTLRSSARLVGRGVVLSGDEAKFREDYDTLQSGGGAEGSLSGRDGRGNYFDLRGSLLGQEAGDAVDGAALRLRAGRWGRYSIRGDFSRTQSFYDDSSEGRFNAFPFTNELGRELDTARTNGGFAADVLFGRHGRVALAYRHRETGGDRSLLKGSVVEGVSPFAFAFPAYQDLDVRADALDVKGSTAVGPLILRANAGFTDERDRTETVETNFGPTALRDQTRFRDDMSLTIVRAGVDVETDPTLPVLGHAGYRFFWVDADGSSSQEIDSVVVRTADGVSVTDRRHAGHVGTAFSPLPHLYVRSALTILDQDRDGDGAEIRGTGTDPVDDRTRKHLRRYRPRVELGYRGLPRTLLRAGYRFEYVDRDLDLSMLGALVGDPGGIDRVQETDENRAVHTLRLAARVRAARQVLVTADYTLVREDIDESVDTLLNEDTLGDRSRDRDTVGVGVRYRPLKRTTLEARGEYQREDYDREDVPGDSSTCMEAGIVELRATTAPTPRLRLSGLVSLADRDYDVGTPRRDLTFFRSIEFEGRSGTGSLAATWAVGDRTTLRGQYSLVDAGRSLDNVNHRLFLSADHRVDEHVSVGLGYAFLDFNQYLYGGDDFTANVVWGTVKLTF